LATDVSSKKPKTMIVAVSLVRSSRLWEPNSTTETKRLSRQAFRSGSRPVIRDVIRSLGFRHHSSE
jgi:hypothetical protein